jgi:hypothetical protein
MRKGQSSLIEYILTILFSVIILIAISGIIYAFYNNILKQDISRSLNEINLQTADAISKIYQQGKASTSSPSNSTSILLASVNLNMPTKISGKNYEIDLFPLNSIFATINNVTSQGMNVTMLIQSSGAKIVAKTTEDPKIVVSKDITNIDVNIQGAVINGINSTLKYYRYNFNGTIYDKIILGEQGIIIDITQMS